MPRPAASIQRNSCMSRSPPRPSLRLGSSRNATSPSARWRASPRSRSSAQPRAGIGLPRSLRRLQHLVGQRLRRLRSNGRPASSLPCRAGPQLTDNFWFGGPHRMPEVDARVPDRIPQIGETGSRSSWRCRDARPSRRCRCAAPSPAARCRRPPAGTHPAWSPNTASYSPTSHWSIAAVHASHHARPSRVVVGEQSIAFGEYHSGIVPCAVTPGRERWRRGPLQSDACIVRRPGQIGHVAVAGLIGSGRRLQLRCGEPADHGAGRLSRCPPHASTTGS